MLVEREVVEKCMKRNKEAQKKLFNAYKSLFVGIAMRYVNRTDLAEDIAQEAFIKIFNNLPGLGSPEAFDAWSRRIVVNTSINSYYKKQSVPFEIWENGIDRSDADLQKQIIQKIDTELLLKVVNTLPDGYRIVFNLYLIDGYSHREISGILNIAESTSRSQLTKAKKFLQKKLEELNVEFYE